MPTSIDHRAAPRSEKSSLRPATISIAVILTGFALLHLIGAAILKRASATFPTEETRSVIRGD
jgi:hypothetical protein